MATSQLYVSTATTDAAGNPQQVRDLTKIKALSGSLCLLSAASGTSNVGGQPATTTLVFVVPGSAATDLVFYSKQSSATAASAILSCVLTNPGAVNATYTLTLSAAEVFTATISVYRAC
jgi:hypothetical protein|nr:MAG: hypothetical protein [Lake Baikal virophage 4]